MRSAAYLKAVYFFEGVDKYVFFTSAIYRQSQFYNEYSSLEVCKKCLKATLFTLLRPSDIKTWLTCRSVSTIKKYGTCYVYCRLLIENKLTQFLLVVLQPVNGMRKELTRWPRKISCFSKYITYLTILKYITFNSSAGRTLLICSTKTERICASTSQITTLGFIFNKILHINTT